MSDSCIPGFGRRARLPGGMRGMVCATFLSILVTACGRNDPAGKKGTGRGDTVRPVKTAVVVEQVMEHTVAVIGTLAAQDEATLSVKVAGRLQTIAVDLGTTVRKGQLIARVEPQDYELQLRQAEALLAQARARLGLPLEGSDDKIELDQASTVKEARARLDEARKNRERIESLTQQGILSESEREAANASYEVAANRYRDALEEVNNRRAQLAQRRVEVEIGRKQLDDTAIHAPFDGAIQERRASPGEYLTAGTPVVTIVRTDPLRLRVEAPERESAAIRTGQKVRIHLEGDERPHVGTVSRVSPAINQQNRMLVVEADIKNDGSLRPGSFVRAEIITRDDHQSLSVPADAIVTFAGIEKVFVVENGKAVEKPVNTGRRGTNWVEVVTGVKVGEILVVSPGNLQTGEAVKIEHPSVGTAAASNGS
jgi:membrane fusion protein, multidrug efflux system